VKKVNLYSALL